MKHSLRGRLWWSFALLAAGVLCVTSAGLLLYLARNPAPVRLLYTRLEIYANVFSQVERLPGARSPERLLAAMQRADASLNLRLVVLDASGALVADTRPEQSPPPRPSDAILDNPPRLPAEFRDTDGRRWVYAARRLDDGSILIVASPRLRISLAQLIREEAYLLPLGEAALAALVLSLVLAAWLSGWISAPLRRLALAAHAVAEGKFKPLPIEGPNEVQEVSLAFNEMSRQVQTSQQAQREFIANVSHDLKTPLTSIQGFSQAILDGTAGSPEDIQESARIIYNEAGRMNRMVLDLLEIARMDSGMIHFEHAPLDLTALLTEITEQFGLQAGQKQIALSTELAGRAVLTGDRDRLVQVFANLLDNAIKFSPAGGKVSVHMEIKNRQVEVIVRDSGPGIPEADLERIFDRFYQVDKNRPSTDSQGGRRGFGLGLAIAKEIILAHGGTIHAYNLHATLDEADARISGCVFVVNLPAGPGPGHQRK